MIVDVYRNLHKSCWSVRDARTGRVVAHSYQVRLVDAKFVVQPGGRARAVKEKRRNVHAFVRGEWADWSPKSSRAIRVTYNPFEMEHFETLDAIAVKEAQTVWLDVNMKAYAKL